MYIYFYMYIHIYTSTPANESRDSKKIRATRCVAEMGFT